MFSVFSTAVAQPIQDISTFRTGNTEGIYFKDLFNFSDAFVGIWENTTGNITFRITLHRTNKKPMGSPVGYYIDTVEGRFVIIQNAGMVSETILYSSLKTYSTGTTFNVISGVTGNGIGLMGTINDNCASGGTEQLEAFFSMHITSPNTALWKIESRTHLAGFTHSVPLEAVLTKVN